MLEKRVVSTAARILQFLMCMIIVSTLGLSVDSQEHCSCF